MSDWGPAPSVPAGVPGRNSEFDFDRAGGQSAGFDSGTAGGFGDGDDPSTAPDDRTCNNCGKAGHLKRDCPDIPEDQRGPGACFNCGEVGHNKADCPNPKTFTGECRHCGKEGHPQRECPDRPAEVCKNCQEEGHNVRECKNTRKIDDDDVAKMDPDDAWKLMAKASKERDLDDFRDALKIYVKAVPDTTYPALEKAFRQNKFNVYVVAYERELSDVFTMMNLQGQLGKKYQVGFFLSDKAPRAAMKESWPGTPEENLNRLADAGIPVETHIPKCNNCGEIGHTSKVCKEERVERADKPEVRCYNCDEVGHRPRDCPKPRLDKFACKNCGQGGHNSRDCPEPPSAANVECRNCGKTGHFGRDCPDKTAMLCNNCGEEGHKRNECPNPANPAMMKCRNCDEMGHSSRECPKPRDWSRVKCQNCGEMGHGKARCPKPDDDSNEDSGDFGGGKDDGGFDGGFGGPSGGGFSSSAVKPVAPPGNTNDAFNDW